MDQGSSISHKVLQKLLLFTKASGPWTLSSSRLILVLAQGWLPTVPLQ